MILVQVTLSGVVQQMAFDQIQFVRRCKYLKCHRDSDGIGEGWFLTINPDQVYCSSAHKVNQFKLTNPNPVVSPRPLSALLH